MQTSVGLALAIPFAVIAGCVDDGGSIDDLNSAAQASTVAETEEQLLDPQTDVTFHTYAVPSVGVGNFADLPVVRTFDHPIASLQLFIVGGRADDIGFVGSRLVTSIPAPCSDVGTVTGEQDVTDQVTVEGDTASFVLRARENCCCRTGWGSATQGDRPDAQFRWVVTFQDAQPAGDLMARSIAWNPGGDGVDFAYEVTESDLQQDTTAGLFWASGPSPDNIISTAFSAAASKTVGTHTGHAGAGAIGAAPDGATHLVHVVDREDTVTEEASNNHVALALPRIRVVQPANATVFHISTAPEMPTMRVALTEIPAALVQALSVNWHTEIISKPGDHLHQIATFAATPIDATVASSNEYQPNFGAQIVGGKLTFTAAYAVAGVPLTSSSADLGLRIFGTDPALAAVEARIRAKNVHPRFPAGGGISYHDVLIRIMRHESLGGHQFLPTGHPVFNQQGDGGVGLFQITPPTSAAQVWNWITNVDSGVSTLNDKMAEAVGWIANRAVAQAVRDVRQQFNLPGNTPVRVIPPPWSRDVMVLREGVQRFNSGNAFQGQGQRVILPNGTTIIEVTWVRTPRNYHVTILGELSP